MLTGNRSEGLLIFQSAVLRLDPVSHRVHETSDSRARVTAVRACVRARENVFKSSDSIYGYLEISDSP